MKQILKSGEPDKLARFRQQSPQADWDRCKRNKRRYQQIQQTLFNDQRGLCAYCEIDLRFESNAAQSDFRVDHFHPKSDTQGTVNWALEWQNLLACCHGGSSATVVDASDRFISDSNEHSCDVPKGNQILDNVILNPLQIPASPALFRHTLSGGLTVNTDACNQAGVDPDQAQATLDHLNLNNSRLNRLRKSQIDFFRDYLQRAESRGQSLDAEREKLAKIYLMPDSEEKYQRFFTTSRSYLGSAAEKLLQATQYDG